MTNKNLLILLLALATTAPADAQGKVKIKTKAKRTALVTKPAPTTPDWSAQYAAQVTTERLRTHLAVLASDEYEGRETGM